MRRINVRVADILEAPAADVYATIADYKEGHPYIIPKENLYDLEVEQGGYGAGTIIRFKSRMLGVEQSFYQRVSEPEPGRVLVEQDIDSAQNESSTFTVIPLEDGQKARAEIAVAINASPGLKGSIERLVIALLFPKMLRKELKLLEAVAQKRATPLSTTH